MARTIIILLALLSVLPQRVEAQLNETLRRGVKVRIMNGAEHRVGYVDTLTADALVIHERLPDGSPGAVASYRRDLLRTVYVVRPRRSGPSLRGTLTGVVIGAGIGYVFGVSTYDAEDCDILLCGADAHGAVGAVFGGLIGLPVGLVISSLRGAREEWDPVKLVP